MLCERVWFIQHEFGIKEERLKGLVGLTSSGSLTSFFFILHKICHKQIVRAMSNDNGNSQGKSSTNLNKERYVTSKYNFEYLNKKSTEFVT